MPSQQWSRRKVLSSTSTGAIVLMAFELIRDWFREQTEQRDKDKLIAAWQHLYEKEAAARMLAEKQLLELVQSLGRPITE